MFAEKRVSALPVVDDEGLFIIYLSDLSKLHVYFALVFFYSPFVHSMTCYVNRGKTVRWSNWQFFWIMAEEIVK